MTRTPWTFGAELPDDVCEALREGATCWGPSRLRSLVATWLKLESLKSWATVLGVAGEELRAGDFLSIGEDGRVYRADDTGARPPITITLR